MMNMHIYKFLSLKDFEEEFGWKSTKKRSFICIAHNMSWIRINFAFTYLPPFCISFSSPIPQKNIFFLLCLLRQSLVKLNICNFYRVSWLIFLFATCPTFIKQMDYLFSIRRIAVAASLPLNTVPCDLCLNCSLWHRKRQFTSIFFI